MHKLTWEGLRGRADAIKVVQMGFKEQMVGQLVLLIYLLATHAAGVDFFQLKPESRAFWLIGAVLVLGAMTEKGKRAAWWMARRLRM